MIIDRYLLREILLTWLAVTLVLLVILISNRLAGYLADAAAGRIAGTVIFTLLGLKAVSALVMLMPLSLYLAMAFTLGRLHKDNEMAALAACGVGPARLYRPLFMVAVPLSLLLAWLAFSGAPWAADL
ncbi:MAG: LptF/LptG family permease, partial [Gammaproteobacteria bacterium]